MKVERIMTKEVCGCTTEQTLDDAARIMWNDDCGSIPVVDHDNVVVGMVTDRDIAMAAHLTGSALSAISVAQTMTKNVIACRPSDRVAFAEGLMIQHQIRRLPVVDAKRRLLGILSLSDFVRAAQLKAAADEKPVTPDDVEATLVAVSAPRMLRAC